MILDPFIFNLGYVTIGVLGTAVFLFEYFSDLREQRQKRQKKTGIE